jgi:hypothetical protein
MVSQSGCIATVKRLSGVHIEILGLHRSGMHLCMQDNQKGQKTMVLPSAENTSLTHFVLPGKNILFFNFLECKWSLVCNQTSLIS